MCLGHNRSPRSMSCHVTLRSQIADRELPTILEELITHFCIGPMTAEAVQDASMAF